MSESRELYLGIDLGTSNSALAVAEGTSSPALVPITQLEASGRLQASPLLPSVAYLADSREIPASDRLLPWSELAGAPLLGLWARDLAQLNPERAVLSAKSWLCYRGAQSPITLPERAPKDRALTPVEASAAYLRHLRQAFTTEAAEAKVKATVLTVPASFDQVARQLTEAAAVEAGLQHVSLLEEPLAAFYAWLAAHPSNWSEELKPGDLVLICDIGGGTSDLSLIAVSEDAGLLRLDRIAVGRHLLLGGDNMDLALAHYCQSELLETELDHWQFLSLQQQVRIAKENLMSSTEERSWPLAIAARGSNLFAQTLRCELSRKDLDHLIVEGFFPFTPLEQEKPRLRATGLARMGLPYENDPAITRHLARFLIEAQLTVSNSPELRARLGTSFDQHRNFLAPTAILFNGGVFHSDALRHRVLDVLKSWQGAPIKELISPGYDQAVALGAAHYARLQSEGLGIRIRAASPRSYYIGLDSNEPAIPGRKAKLQGLCILPQGTEEGSSLSLPEQEFGLWTGEELSFRLFSSQTRSSDLLGSLVNDAETELDEVSELSCRITTNEESAGLIPVYLRSDYTDVGALQLAMQHSLSSQNWQLEFQLRSESEPQHA